MRFLDSRRLNTAELGTNDHQEDAPHFLGRLFAFIVLFLIKMSSFRALGTIHFGIGLPTSANRLFQLG